STASTSATILSEHPIAARWRAIRAGAGRGGGERGGGARRHAALIPYLTAGHPTPAASLEALKLVEAAGADFLEVGVPFSDPLADGPTIQRSTQAALDGGMTVPRVLELIGRAALGIPVVIMTYLNPVLAYGLERFVADGHAAGARHRPARGRRRRRECRDRSTRIGRSPGGRAPAARPRRRGARELGRDREPARHAVQPGAGDRRPAGARRRAQRRSPLDQPAARERDHGDRRDRVARAADPLEQVFLPDPDGARWPHRE